MGGVHRGGACKVKTLRPGESLVCVMDGVVNDGGIGVGIRARHALSRCKPLFRSIWLQNVASLAKLKINTGAFL